MRGISDAQQSSVIAVVAKIPVAEARKPFLVELEKQLPKAGKVTDERLLQAINAALKSFPPAAFCGDSQGPYPTDISTLSLREAADLYLRMIREVGAWCWPPKPPPTPEQLKAAEAKLASMTQEERAERYHRSLFATDAEYEADKRAKEARRRAEETADATPWPVDPSPPPRVPVINATARRDDEPEPQRIITPLAERARPKQLSIYGQAMARLRGELPEAMSDAERAEAINEKLRQERRQRRRAQGAPKAFFR